MVLLTRIATYNAYNSYRKLCLYTYFSHHI